MGIEERGAIFRVHLDDVPDAERFVVTKALHGVTHSIVWLNDFDDDERGIENDAFVLPEGHLHDEHVGDAITDFRYAGAAFGANIDWEGLF